MQANSPDPAKIPPEDAVGVTVVLLTCSYKGSEFVRVGFYVNNEYADPDLAENAPGKPIFEKVSQPVYGHAHPHQPSLGPRPKPTPARIASSITRGEDDTSRRVILDVIRAGVGLDLGPRLPPALPSIYTSIVMVHSGGGRNHHMAQ